MRSAKEAKPKLRIMFSTITPSSMTTFGVQLSTSKGFIMQLFSTLEVCPQFCAAILGEPDYWAPLAVRSRDKTGIVFRVEYMYQHPRYTIHTRQQPCSVWFAYNIQDSTTTYIVSHGKDEDWVTRAKDRLSHCFGQPLNEPMFASAEGHDPFLFHSILCHESLCGAKIPITQLRHKLYDVLDIVGEYSKEPFDRSSLKDMTEQLHKISQDADSLLVSAEMGSMVANHSENSRTVLKEELGASIAFANSNVGDALVYLVESLEAQKRWISSYQSRKDIAMNLVFNLVTQQDSETSTDIARDTKEDSASMRVIAVLTMIFLPATAVSGFFGMDFFSISAEGDFVTSKMVWLFIAVTMPLTILIFVLWIFWVPLIQSVPRYILDRWIIRVKPNLATASPEP
ncbi:hypothetical protein F4806DRAFT_475765 [Annulohypoxylon nitens]|nr:hypothetical protein F4806DRAFT_475765 [Annulohypoxylon nitens]